LHWPFENPATAEGTEFEKLRSFRQVRNEIAYHVKKWVEKVRTELARASTPAA
jgi:hypothetical protein